ncbi:unnamed protein product, partial [Hapterophycus canaliculatus]
RSTVCNGSQRSPRFLRVNPSERHQAMYRNDHEEQLWMSTWWIIAASFIAGAEELFHFNVRIKQDWRSGQLFGLSCVWSHGYASNRVISVPPGSRPSLYSP